MWSSEFPADVYQDCGQGSHWDQLDDVVSDDEKQYEEYSIVKIDPGSASAAVDACSAFDDAGNDGQTADQTGADV